MDFGMFGMGGPWEIMVILAVALLLFGNKLPGAARNLGRSMIEFKKGMRGVESDEDEDPKQLERQPREEAQASETVSQGTKEG